MMKDRIERILTNRLYNECIAMIAECERNRIFCRHDTEHFIGTARIAYILSLEEKAGIDKELVYAAALLHDIGRHRQYTDGIPHERAGAQIASAILSECGFSVEEIELITAAIGAHRDKKNAVVCSDSETATPDVGAHRDTGDEKKGLLAGVLYRADKLSRECWRCDARPECSWSEEKKNQTLVI